MLFAPEAPELNETDLQIYRYVISHLHDFEKGISIRRLAVETSTSTASLLRFCRKFGTSGYTEFRIRLLAWLSTRHGSIDSAHRIDPEDELISFFSRIRDRFYQDRIDEAACLLLEKELILFIGLGSSDIVARYGARFFCSHAEMAVHIEDPDRYTMDHLSAELAKRICAIVLSVSGETTKAVRCVEQFNMIDVPVISITNNRGSTIARLSAVNIPYYLPVEDASALDNTSQIPAIYIIERLAEEMSRTSTTRTTGD